VETIIAARVTLDNEAGAELQIKSEIRGGLGWCPARGRFAAKNAAAKRDSFYALPRRSQAVKAVTGQEKRSEAERGIGFKHWWRCKTKANGVPVSWGTEVPHRPKKKQGRGSQGTGRWAAVGAWLENGQGAGVSRPIRKGLYAAKRNRHFGRGRENQQA